MNNRDIQKRKKGIQTQQQVLEVAADLFARKGYDGVSLREIALAVGIKESSLYNHFANKLDILQSLFEKFKNLAPLSRPSEEELEKMLLIMDPEEIFKSIMFFVGNNISSLLANTAIIINNEKCRNEQAAKAYFQYMVDEPVEYYERLIIKMSDRGMAKKENARNIAEQYNYVSLSLTQEYFMSKNGYADTYEVVRRMVNTIKFFCSCMRIG